MPAPRKVLEFFRVDQVASFRRVLVPAVMLLTVGPPLVLVSATMKQVKGHEILGFLGAVLMFAGLLIGFGGIGALLADDRYVAVTEDGLLVHLGREETFFAWDALARVRAEGNELVIECTSSEPLRISFGRNAASPIAERLEDWRRKSAWNLAPSPRS